MSRGAAGSSERGSRKRGPGAAPLPLRFSAAARAALACHSCSAGRPLVCSCGVKTRIRV